jgi:hypothetical protein
MKKLILVIVLAVVASKMISRPPRHASPAQPAAAPFRVRVVGSDGNGHWVLPPTPTEPAADEPDAIRTIPWKGESPRQAPDTPWKLAQRSDETAPTIPAPPRKPKRPATKRPPAPTRAAPAPAVPAPKTPPSWFPMTIDQEDARARPDVDGVRVIVGQLSSTEERARTDARDKLREVARHWLAADVPTDWALPETLLDGMVIDGYVQTVTRSFPPAPGEAAAKPSSKDELGDIPGLDDVFTLHRMGLKVDTSSARKMKFVNAYRRDVVNRRLTWMGGGLGLTLAALAALSGFIRADEATKGYYTNRLRVLALAGLAGSGAAVYWFLA